MRITFCLAWIELRRIAPVGGACDVEGRTSRCESDLRCDAGLCVRPACGDGVVDDVLLGEACDDANEISRDGCSALCQVEPAICGDGTIGPTEQCDDGGRRGGDGCDADCGVEDGGSCEIPIDLANAGVVDESGAIVFTGNAGGGFDDGAGSCGGAGLEDVVHRAVVGPSGALLVEVEGDGTPYVWVSSPCGGPELGCAAAGSTVELFDLPAGEVVGIIVEAQGAYTLTVSACGGGEAEPEIEPNDSVETAQRLRCIPAVVSAYADEDCNNDFWAFTVDHDGTYSIATDSPDQCGHDTTLRLLDGAGTELDFNDDDEDRGCCCSRLVRDLTPGTYYAHMQPFWEWIGFPPCPPGDYSLLVDEL